MVASVDKAWVAQEVVEHVSPLLDAAYDLLTLSVYAHEVGLEVATSLDAIAFFGLFSLCRRRLGRPFVLEVFNYVGLGLLQV